MRRLEVSGAVRHIYASLGFKGLNNSVLHLSIRLLSSTNSRIQVIYLKIVPAIRTT